MTFESARVSDFSPNVIFAVKWHRICDLGTWLFSLADLVWVVSVWGHFGQTINSCRNLTCSHFNANILKSTRSFI